MKCTEVGQLVMDVAAGALTDPQLEAHIRSCVACNERLEAMQRTMALLDTWVAPAPSPYFDSRLRTRMREEPKYAQGWFAWMRKPALAAAMAALLVIGGMLYYPSHQAEAPPVQAQPGTAVGDLQELDTYHELFANFDLLDELAVDQPQSVNP